MPQYVNLPLATLAAAVLVACGGGNNGVPSPSTPAATRGVAVDGYLKMATVVCDANGNGVADASETRTTTGSDGTFIFPKGCAAGVVVTGGISIDTGLPFPGVLRAPAGSTVASPLTTLVAAGMTQAQVKTALGLSQDIDLLTTDPAKSTGGMLDNPDLMKKTLAVQQLMQKATEVFTGMAGVAGSATMQPVYAEVAAAFATTLKGGGKLVATQGGAALDGAVVTSLIKAATQQVASSSRVPADVKGAAGTVNADSLALVSAGAIVAQADSILKAANAELTAVTRAQQGEEGLAAFMAQKKTEMTSAPSAATVALAQNLTSQVSQSGPAPAPTNYLAVTNDAITLINGSETAYTMAGFESPAGISTKWPLGGSAAVRLGFTQVGTFSLATGQTVSAAIEVSQGAGSGSAQLRAYIDKIAVTRSGDTLAFVVAPDARALVYGVSANGQKKAVMDFSASAVGVSNNLSLGSSNTVLFGDVIDYVINQVSNDFTGMTALRGTYKVTVVVTDLPLRRANGTRYAATGIDIPIALGVDGAVTESVAVVGSGLQGTITLTD